MSQEERRGAPRQEVSGVARILLGQAKLDCQLRNISETGAKLDVADTVALPDEIEIEIFARRRRARIMWRSAGCMGVSFMLKRSSKGAFGRRSTPPDPIVARGSSVAGMRESLARLKALLTLSDWLRAEPEAAIDVAPSYPELLARIGVQRTARADS